MYAGHRRFTERCRRTTITAVLLFLISVLLPQSGSVDNGNGRTDVKAYRVSRPFFTAAASPRQCAQLQDLQGYGVNLNLFLPDTVYLNGEYFCAESAPAQYRCRCGIATSCKKKLDPWGRNIGFCNCCSSWMIGCFVLLGIFSAISIFGALYVIGCQGKWWCNGYAILKMDFIPRCGRAVSCPPSQPVPQTLFRGYEPSDFTNTEASIETPVSTPAASTAAQVNTSRIREVNHEAMFGSDAEDGEARGQYTLLPQEFAPPRPSDRF